MKNIKNRIDWIDYSRGICMLFVMLSHTECPTIYRTIFGPVFLSMFFFISGYLFNNKRTFKEYFINKTKTLLLPFFILGVFNILTRQIITFNEQKNVLLELEKFILQIGNTAGLWFIACLYVASLFFYPINKYTKNRNQYLLIITILGIVSIVYNKIIGISLPWHIQKMGIAIFFMGMGYLYKEKYEQQFKKYENKKILIYCIVIYIILLLLNYIIYKNTYTSFNTYDTGVIIYITLSLLSIWILILIAKLFIKNSFIKFVGQNTLIYFAFHGKVQSILMKIINKFIVLNFWNVFILSILVTLLESIILILPSMVINKYFPWILGRKNENCNE